jgi:hypothetical protein
MLRNTAWIASLCLAFMLSAPDAWGFTFADGASMGCYANAALVPETVIDAPPVEITFTGKTIRSETGYQIVWNEKKLNSLPPEVHDFIFFHECAHAKVDTVDETMANCAGLKDMRAAGRAGPAVEARLAAFYGPGNAYWMRTLKCADGH